MTSLKLPGALENDFLKKIAGAGFDGGLTDALVADPEERGQQSRIVCHQATKTRSAWLCQLRLARPHRRQLVPTL